MKKIFLLVFAFALFAFPAKAEVKAPFILDINPDVNSSSQVFVRGYSSFSAIVSVYIDGIYQGEVDTSVAGTEVFPFNYYLNGLLPTGAHEVFVVARDKNSLNTSARSSVKSFYFSTSLKAPSILSAGFKNGVLTIDGQTENNTFVCAYVDNQHKGCSSVQSGFNVVNNFRFNLSNSLNEGSYSLYLIAYDSLGRTSLASGVYNFIAKAPYVAPVKKVVPVSPKKEETVEVLPKITEVAETEEDIKIIKVSEEEVVEEPKVAQIDEENSTIEIPNKEAEIETEEVESELINLEDFLNSKQSTSSNDDLVNDNKQANQLRKNLFIFLVFLVAIVAWLIWLNRELSQEKKENAEDDTDSSDSKE